MLFYDLRHISAPPCTDAHSHVLGGDVFGLVILLTAASRWPSRNVDLRERPEREEEDGGGCCICYAATISRKNAAALPTDTCKHAKRAV